MGITRIWDAINDPLMGVLIDRRRFKNGEKLRPYLLFTPIIIGLLTLLMFLSPFENPTAKIVYIFLFISLGIFLYIQDIAQWGMTSLISPLSEKKEPR